MKHKYPVYLFGVVLPSALAVVAATHFTRAAGEATHARSDARVARTVLSVFQQELGRTVDSLLAVAAPETGVDRSDPLVARALAGDTLHGLRPVTDGLQVFVLAPPRRGDPAGSIRLATAPLPTASAMAVGQAVAYATALFVGERRAAGTEPAAGPEALSDAMLRGLSEAPGGLRVGPGGQRGSLVSLGDARGAGVSAFASPRTTPPRTLPTPLLLVIGLLFVFAALAGWIQTGGQSDTRRPGALYAFLLIALVPPLTAAAFLVQADRHFRANLEDATTQDLSRVLTVARMAGALAAPATVRLLTGVDATLVRGDSVVASTFPKPVEALADLPAPPGSFTSSGEVATPAGPSTYVALRDREGGVLVVTAPEPSLDREHLRAQLRAVALLLGIWFLGMLAVLGVRSTSSAR